MVRDLAISMRRLEATTRVENELDEELLSQLPEPVSPVSDDEARLGLVEMVGRNPAGKRSLPDISSRKPVTKKPRFPYWLQWTRSLLMMASEGLLNSEP